MLKFPTKLNIKNKDNFPEYFKDQMLCYLRKCIYEHILKHSETEYFDIHKFNSTHVENTKLITELIDQIIKELEDLGWTCTKSFGGTGLFVYSDKNKPPVNCWKDDIQFE